MNYYTYILKFLQNVIYVTTDLHQMINIYNLTVIELCFQI